MIQTLTQLFAYKAWADGELIGAVAALCDDPVQHSAVRLLNHIRVVDDIFCAHLQGKPSPHDATNTTNTPTLADLTAAYGRNNAWLADHVQGLTPDGLQRRIKFKFTDGDTGDMSTVEILMHLITHGTYHRGAVGRMLVHANANPPRDLFTKFLHQSEPERRWF